MYTSYKHHIDVDMPELLSLFSITASLHLPGQLLVLHISMLMLLPSQVVPPTHLLVLVLDPPLQVLVHRLQEDHFDQTALLLVSEGIAHR